MNKHKHYDVIVAWAEGKTVQYYAGGWEDITETSPSPNFHPDVKFRIKPDREYKHRAFYPVVFVGQEYVAQYNGEHKLFLLVNLFGGVHRLKDTDFSFIGEELTEDHWRR